MNQPIKVQPEVKGGGGDGRSQHGVALSNRDGNTVNVQETCPIRCIRDCFSSTWNISRNANPVHPPLRSTQVKSMMQDKGVAQSVMFFFFLDVMRLLFNL